MSSAPPVPSAGGEPLPGRVGADGPAARSDAASGRLAVVVFAVLVLACFAAFLITQRLKHTPTLVHVLKLTNAIEPASDGELREEHIAFELAEADKVTVTIESSSGEDVATLVRDLPAPRYKILSLRWNGHEGTARGYKVLRRADGYTTLIPVNRGPLAPAGEYRVRLSLRKQRRSIVSQRDFKLVRQ